MVKAPPPTSTKTLIAPTSTSSSSSPRRPALSPHAKWAKWERVQKSLWHLRDRQGELFDELRSDGTLDDDPETIHALDAARDALTLRMAVLSRRILANRIEKK